MSELRTVAFNDGTRKLLDGRNFATIATLNPDGSPQSSVVWIKREGDAVVFSTISVRQKARNLSRDPRISLSIFDLENPYHSVEIRGTAELIEGPERKLSKELSQRYLGKDPPGEPTGVVRLIVRVIPTKITEFTV
jgi:PPOX class probable F420-dependent enzyme